MASAVSKCFRYFFVGRNNLKINDLTKFIYPHKYCVFGKNCVTLQR